MPSARPSASTRPTGVISTASCAGRMPRAGNMKSLEEILKSSGLNDATTRANGASPPGPSPEPALDEADDLCPRCGGAGFVRKAVRLGHPDFGKAFACECIADEREDQRLARLQRYSNLGPLARLTFADLSPLGRSPNTSHQEHF